MDITCKSTIFFITCRSFKDFDCINLKIHQKSTIKYKKHNLIAMTKTHLQYPLNSNSRNIIWHFIGTIGGLEAWMADKIIESNGVYTFQWGKEEMRKAELLGSREGVYIRFHWLDEGPKTYFELRINVSELTKAHILEITEISRNEEEEDLNQMWESQMEELRRVAGL